MIPAASVVVRCDCPHRHVPARITRRSLTHRARSYRVRMMGTVMKNGRWTAALLSAVALVVAMTAGQARSEKKTDAVARGRYLVTAMGCNDCHTPLMMTPQGPAPDMSRMLSGHPGNMEMPAPPAPSGPWMWSGAGTMTAFAGPWGITFAPNLTPDMTGLGVYTEETFIGAMRTGKRMGVGRDILPPMPWQNVSALTDDDLKAVFAYLRSIPPIQNTVPAYRAPEGMSHDQ